MKSSVDGSGCAPAKNFCKDGECEPKYYRMCAAVSVAGVVGAMAVALHVSCALQHVKGNAETEGKSALEIRVAEQEVWVVRNAPQEGAGLLRARAKPHDFIFVRRLASLCTHRMPPAHVVVQGGISRGIAVSSRVPWRASTISGVT